MRRSGILLPISSLPSKYGIGTFGKEAYEFVDFLKKAKQTLWQILPICPTSFGDSPYQSFSTFAGNPYFIDLDILKDEGLLKKNEYQKIDWGSSNLIDYGLLNEKRFVVLKKAFKRFDLNNEDYLNFKNDNDWLNDYALFMAIKDYYHGASFDYWDEDLKLRKKKALDKFKETNYEQIEFYIFIQYEFFKQWYKLKKYANDNGIKIIGDCPIYVALDSADVWSNPKLFQLNENLIPEFVAGCPPDAFSDDGQLWGNPLYDWSVHQKTNFDWWIKRIAALNKMYDIIRIDHFIGFASYYAIPFGNKDGRIGERKKGPGIALFNALKNKLGDIEIIAEDLGVLLEEVVKLLNECNFPGMKVLMFAFGDKSPKNPYLPHNMIHNCVCYIGTHDNEPIMAYKDMIDKDAYEYAKKYIGCKKDKEFNWDMIKTLESTVADTVIIQCQDLLGLGIESRINHPSTLGKNWKWRLKKGQLKESIAIRLKELTEYYNR